MVYLYHFMERQPSAHDNIVLNLEDEQAYYVAECTCKGLGDR